MADQQPTSPGQSSPWAFLAKIGPLIAAAGARGGREGIAGLLQGYQQAQLRHQQEQRQAGLDANTQAYQQHQIAAQDAAAADARARGAAQTDYQTNTQRMTFLKNYEDALATYGSPEDAQRALPAWQGVGQQLGIDPTTLAQRLPPASAYRTRKIQSWLAKNKPTDAAIQAQADYQMGDLGVVPFAEWSQYAAVPMKDGKVVAPEAKSDDLTKSGLAVQAADALRRGDMEEYNRLIQVQKAIGQADDRPSAGPRDRFSVQPVTLPDGKTGLIRVNLDTGAVEPVQMPTGVAGAGRSSDTEALSKAYYDRTTASDALINGIEKQLVGLGSQLDVYLPNLMKSRQGRAYKQAQDEFINAALRKESGAAIQQSEYDRYSKIYFVQPGDDDATIRQKQAARQRVIDGFKVTAGNLGGQVITSEDNPYRKKAK
jgi:hypothetical protein